MSDEAEEPEFGLVMPFVVCRSQGGVYEDDSYVAGYEAGLLDAMLASEVELFEGPLRSDNVALLDLLAMRYGYEFEAEPTDDLDEWTMCRFTKTVVAP